MLRLCLSAVLVALAVPATAQSEKEISCALQGDVVKAIQQARLDRVRERDVQKTILDSDPAWPDNFDNAIPLITPWVYELPMKQVQENDLGKIWADNCMLQ